MNHHGAPVKWIGQDGGWKTGHLVAPDGKTLGLFDPHHWRFSLLVQHSCTGEIEWVDEAILDAWQPRDEWEK